MKINEEYIKHLHTVGGLSERDVVFHDGRHNNWPVTVENLKALWVQRDAIFEYRRTLEDLMTSYKKLRETMAVRDPDLLAWAERWERQDAD